MFEIIYKGLKFRRGDTPNYLELVIEDKNFSDFSNYIHSTSLLVEYALHTLPDYIILNKLNTSFQPFKELYGFTRQHIIAPLKQEGIKKIIVLTHEHPYVDKFSDDDDDEPFMIGKRTIHEAIEFMNADHPTR